MLLALLFDFEREGNLDLLASFSSSLLSVCYSHSFELERDKKEGCFLGSEPSSVLDTIASPTPSPPTSTLSGVAGGAGSTDTVGVAAVSGNPSQKWPPLQQEQPANCLNVGGEISAPPPVLDIATAAAAAEKCGMGVEDWETMLTETTAASPSQEQSILRWIMGDMDDPSLGLNKLLQSGGGGGPDHHFDFNGGFGAVDQGFGLDPDGSGGGNLVAATVNPSLPISSGFTHKFGNEKLGLAPPNPPPPLPNFKLPNPIFSPFSQRQEALECSDIKPQIFNPQLLINHHQATQNAPNPAFFLPLQQYAPQQDQHLVLPTQAKRYNLGGAESMLQLQPQPQLLPQYLQQRPAMGVKPKPARDEMGHHQQAIIDQLYKAAELVQAGNSVHAHGILARLNHQLTPIGKPFHRAAFLCKEALQSILHQSNTLNSNSPFNLIMKIGAYKSFSEISPLLQFANFTCNQALLEVLAGFDRIHIVDFDIGYGGQWASLMQELAMRSGGAPSLRITVFALPSTQDQLELSFTRENLIHFAGEINMAFEFDILSFDSLNSASWSLPLHHVNDNETVAVNLPVGSFSNHHLPLPLVLRFVKQLSPKIMVSVDRSCDRTDLPFPNHVIHVLHSHSALLESLDAVNMNLDALQKIERFLLQPGIEKIVLGRFHSPEKTPHWRTLFLSSGFSPIPFSNFAESQAECVIKRTPVRGFHFEKRQSSLVLCWQRKELISASAWRCRD